MGEPLYSKGGPWTRSLGIAWELVQKADSGLIYSVYFNKIPRWGTVKSEKDCTGLPNPTFHVCDKETGSVGISHLQDASS